LRIFVVELASSCENRLNGRWSRQPVVVPSQMGRYVASAPFCQAAFNVAKAK